MDVYLFSQLIGLFGFLAQFMSGYQRCSHNIIYFACASNLLWAFHYIVLAIPLAAIMSILAAKRLYLCRRLPHKYLKYIVVVSIVIFVGVAGVTYNGFYSLLPVFGSIGFTLSLLYRDSATIVRLGGLWSTILWMFHGFVTGSYIEIGANSIAMVAMIYGIFIHDLKADFRWFKMPFLQKRT